MSIHVRKYYPSDREFISSLVTRFSEFKLPEWRTKIEVDQANQQNLLKALDEPEPGSAIFTAEDENGVPAGFIHLEAQSDYFSDEKQGYISFIAVSPAFEGQGVGRMLLDTAEIWAREQNFRLLTLYVFAGNTHAKHIYEKCGFGQEVIKYVKDLR